MQLLAYFSLCLGLAGAGSRETIEVFDPYFGSVEREYLIYLPSSYADDIPHPVVLDFHGHGGSAERHILDSKWDVVGEEFGVIVVVPNGIPDSDRGSRAWNVSKEFDEEYGWRCDPEREEYGESECHYSCTEWCNPSFGCTAGVTCYDDLAFIEQLIDKLMVRNIQIENHVIQI